MGLRRQRGKEVGKKEGQEGQEVRKCTRQGRRVLLLVREKLGVDGRVVSGNVTPIDAGADCSNR
jgi:hypothetical protein